MTVRANVAAACFFLWLPIAAALAQSAVPAAKDTSRAKKPDPNAAFRSQIIPFLSKHCFECHGPDAQEGDIALDRYKDAAAVAEDQKTWQRVIQMLRSGAMPPEDAKQPSEAERRRVVQWIEQAIYNFDCDNLPDPGRVTIRRLNRAEYNNTVRDLLGVTFRPADDFPSDDVGGGFDNIGDVLTLPPLLMEKYLAAAERLAEEVIVADPSIFVKSIYRDRRLLTGEGGARYDFDRRRWTLDGPGSVSTEFTLPRDGQYNVRVYARAQGSGDQPPQLELRLDGATVKIFDIIAADGGGKYETKWTVAGGVRRLSAQLVTASDNAGGSSSQRDRAVVVGAFEIDGPIDLRPQDYPPAHQKLIATRPGDGRSVNDAAKQNLRPFLTRAFRRPVSEDEVNRFAALADNAVKEGDSFEQGMQVALTAVLVSPHFLFRAEWDDRKADAESAAELNDFQLASRLSYFLWSSMPDDELFAAAAAGKFRDDKETQRQIQRMLADPKSESLVQNFAIQWLNLRLLDETAPDPNVFPEFDVRLKADMRRETELFAAAIIREDRSVLDFLQGRFTFVNQRLAEHYGLSGVTGDEFQRVNFSDQKRTGVLTQASILTLTSNPGRTSPVKRGKWILENILGSPPPDPPPDAPDLEATQKAQPDLPLRKQLEIHRQNAVCASCHKVMDQLGFGLENFDAIGRWRDKDGKFPVDASAELPGGARFSGPLELASVLHRRKSEFARCLTEKLLTFALGRELQVHDRCAVDKIVEEVEAKDYRFSALVEAIAKSDPFRKRRPEGDVP
jgi:mono/diheme cytochrome c family protein